MWWSVPLLASLFALRAWSASSGPDIEKTKFKLAPSYLFYFDDSDTLILSTRNPLGGPVTAYRSDDAGWKWEELEDQENLLAIIKHPYNSQVAVALGTEVVHWITNDQGKTWRKFISHEQPNTDPRRPTLSFHATDPDRIILFTQNCEFIACSHSAYYTTDGFDKSLELLHENAFSCLWAKSTPQFTTGSAEKDLSSIMCIVRGKFDLAMSNNRLLISDDFFKTEEEPLLSNDRAVMGIINLAAVKGYIAVAAKSEHTTELAMYTTTSTTSWARAEFGDHKLEESAYTILESTNYSMQVDVMVNGGPSFIGELLTSNSNGTHFKKNVEHTHRNEFGFVDFEKIQNIQGIILVNIVENAEKVIANGADKKVKSQISFDDGRTWSALKSGDDNVHLHSVTDQRNPGRVFSSPAPGIVIGVGNLGEYLGVYEDADVYVSDDAGLTWSLALRKPHYYEFGDQGAIIVAVEDGLTDKVKWSLNHGQDWSEYDLGHQIKPVALMTVPDSTSLKFTLIAKTRDDDDEGNNLIIAMNFDGLHEKKCKSGDFEEWYARVDDDGEPTCIMGHTQKFSRRKADAKCFVDEEFKDPTPETEDCKCKDEDYECDFANGFSLNNGKCAEVVQQRPKDGDCEGSKKTFMVSSGYSLIPGNTCIKKDGVVKDEPIERDCDAAPVRPPASGKITNEITKFRGDEFKEYYYLERQASNSDETAILARTLRGEVFITFDHGRKWAQILEGEEIVAIYPHQYINEIVYFITPSKKVHYSKNRGKDIHSFEAPDVPNHDRLQILAFHPNEPDWLIWTGSRDCPGDACQTVAHASRKGGDDWETLLKGVRKCQFVYREGREDSDEMIYCEQYENENSANHVALRSSKDWFDHSTVVKKDVINFAMMAEYIVVALRDPEQDTLQVQASIDGVSFAEAKFPPNFNVPHQQAYTVLDSSTHAVFLHVTVNNGEGKEYGSIVKSNSNGTSYVLSASEVNRNVVGYVDFEKMKGLEGVALINRVSNVEQVENGAQKKLKTYITHNDGADWDLIPRPTGAPEGKKYPCDGDRKICSLHLHGYTERLDPRDSFSSPSAVGMMIATGNVGEYLTDNHEADTFITRDGGVTWHPAAPGNWQWEYGDQGSVIVMVRNLEPTSKVIYSLDEGNTWNTYEFSSTLMQVQDISTVPSDTGLNFVLWGKMSGELVTVNIDFSGLTERSKQCFLDEQNPESEKSDYKLWSPQHPTNEEGCLFGHVAQYHRKKDDRDCYNGGVDTLQHLHAVDKNCSCTRHDFECDYNYERQTDGSCRLVEGLEAADPADVCKKDPNLVEYYAVTGYRRIPLTTCTGGKEMDFTSKSHPCPGHETEYEKKHGISGIGLFFAIVLPIAAAVGIGYWVWQHWDGNFGRIRLGNDFSGGSHMRSGSFGYGAFDRDAPWIKYPIVALSGIVAVLATLPMLAGSLWNAVSTRLGRRRSSGYSRPYTSRSSFARGRGDYAVVAPDDEGELLGDDSDDDV